MWMLYILLPLDIENENITANRNSYLFPGINDSHVNNNGKVLTEYSLAFQVCPSMRFTKSIINEGLGPGQSECINYLFLRVLG